MRAALQSQGEPASAEQVAAMFAGAPVDRVTELLEALAGLGQAGRQGEKWFALGKAALARFEPMHVQPEMEPNMSRDFTKPQIVKDGSTYSLKRSDALRSEGWLQEFLFKHPDVLPVNEIEPVFGPLRPVCRELRTSRGLVDLLFANPQGLLTVVECKLWQNPQARREVIGQILEYAKELNRWSYQQLDSAVRRYAASSRSLYEIAAAGSEESDEVQFVDNVSRNLRRGRFLLLVVGDGIKEGVEEIGEFLRKHAHMSFGFGLVELAMFDLPDNFGGGRLIQPRVVAQTVEIVRAVVRLEGDGLVASPVQQVAPSGPAKRSKISEVIYYEELRKVDADAAAGLPQFIERAQDLGIALELGDSSIMLKLEEPGFNFAVFKPDGTFLNRGTIGAGRTADGVDIGEVYLSELAELIPGCIVQRSKNPFYWTVRKRDQSYPRIAEGLEVQDAWLDLIQRTMDQLVGES